MYTESATRYRAVTLNAVTGRSCSTTVWELAGTTSVNQGEAASCRRNVVYAWMSTVLPVTVKRTAGAAALALVSGGAIGDAVACGRDAGERAIGRQRLRDLIENVRPHVPVAIDATNDGDLGEHESRILSD